MKPLIVSSHAALVLFIGLVCLTQPTTSSAQLQLTRDVFAGGNINFSKPEQFTALGSDVIFVATTGAEGKELWKTNGTGAGTSLVKDILIGSGSSNPRIIGVIGGTLYFAATDGVSGIELWKTDGTEVNTVMVTDIFVGSGDALLNNTNSAVIFNSAVFFTARDSANNYELWTSNGTSLGTTRVKDIRSGTTGSVPLNYVVAGTNLFFTADEGTTGSELWRTDGTLAGTILTKDIRTGSGNGSSPLNITAVGSSVYFVATTDATGYEPWVSDGTNGGTVQVKEMVAGSGSSAARGFTAFNGAVFFAAQTSSFNAELWKTDGTSSGTVLVKEIRPGTAQFQGSEPFDFMVVGSTLFFIADDGTNGRELWKSDGTTAGTELVKDINPGAAYSTPFTNGGTANYQMTVMNGTLYFYAKDATNGSELWKSDGSTGGTVVVKDLFPGVSDANIGSLKAIGTKLYFAGDDSTSGPEPFVSDGSAVGTVLLKDLGTGTGDSNPTAYADASGTLFFAAHDSTNGSELWSTDGTLAGTNLTKNVNPSVAPNDLQELGALNGTAYFAATDGASGVELWRSDGTALGTFLLKDIYPGVGLNSFPYGFVALGDTLFFNAETTGKGIELWKTDGTTAGTVLVKDINVGANDSSAEFFTPVGSNLYFVADDDTHGAELWKTNGTAAGTVMVKDINGDSFGSDVTDLTNLNGTLVFAADSPGGTELWKSNGTAAGTVLVKDLNPNGSSTPSQITAMSTDVFFTAFESAHGTELWKSNGTAVGTVMVKDIVPGSGSSFVSGSDAEGSYNGSGKISYVVMGSNIYFTAQTPAQGRELWKSDGTDAGTVIVKDIVPGAVGSFPKRMVVAGGFIYFDADIGGVTNLWKTDGTDAGTTMVDASVTNIQRIVLSGTSLYVSGQKDGEGQEIFVLPNVRPATITINTHPLAQAVNPGATVTFTAAATGTGPLTYRWRKNGAVIPGATTATLRLSKVTEASEARYDLLVRNGTDSVISHPAQLMVNDPVVITGQPTAVLAATGTSASFTAVFTGTASVNPQWYKGTVLMPGSIANPLTINPVTLEDAALYKVKLTNLVNSAFTTPAQLAVVNAATQIVGVNHNSTMVLTAPAKGTGLSYLWFRNGTQLNVGDLGGRIKKVNGSTLSMAQFTVADEALFSCRVSLGAQQVMSGNLDVRLRNKPDITGVVSPTGWIVSGTVNQAISSLITINNPQPQHAPTSYTITGLPKGLTYSKTTGQIIGKAQSAGTGTLTLKVTATNGAGASSTVTVLVHIDKLPAEAIGEFRGIATRNTFNNNLGASVTITIAPTGGITGKLMHGTVALPFTSTAVDATVGSNTVSAIVTVKRTGTTPLQLALTDINGTTGEVTGTISDGVAISSYVSAWRNPWHTTAPANAAAQYARDYTAAFQISMGQMPNPIDDEAYPQGDGYALLKLSTAGVVTGACRLADGTSITVSTLFGPQGQIALYLPAYSNTGSALGWTQVTANTSNPPTSYASNLLDGALSWFKAPSFARSYSGGIALHNLTIIGGAWKKPDAPLLVLGLADAGVDNAKLTFTKARINETSVAASNQLLQTFRIKAPTNAISVPANTATLVVKTFSTTTGEFIGTWKTRDTNPQPPGQQIDRTANYYGALVNRLNQGTGHFTLDRLPTVGKTSKTTDILSGKAVLHAHP